MTYFLPTTISFGEGALKELPEILSPFGQKVALCTGGNSFRSLKKQVLDLLNGKTVIPIEGIEAEPEIARLKKIIVQLKEEKPDVIVAIGGGSVLDMAKGIAFALEQNASINDILDGNIQNAAPSIPLIAIPTTAGTGSDVTPFAVFWDHKKKKKYSLAHEELYPTHAIVDPVLTYSMPPAITACTGMDAFTQACEAYWNVNHNPTSDAYALEAVELILPALPRAVANGNDTQARHDVMLGSLKAGQAFSNTRTGACHSISYPMTLYYGVTHGQAVGITLPEILKLNADVMPDRVDDFCRACGGGSIDEVADRIYAMMQESGLKTRLSDLGIDEEGIDVIVENGFTPERMKNNPCQFTEESLHKMLHTIL